MHGSVTDGACGRAMLAGADVIANFALAAGDGRSRVRANNSVIKAIVDGADPTARIVFFSTQAVNGEYGRSGELVTSAYGDIKRRNEQYFSRLTTKSRSRGWVLRLGHVCGEEQNITHIIRAEIAAGEVWIPDPSRLSNTTHVVAIAEALIAIGEGRSAEPGVYDLVNEPQWTWREVYEREAALTLQKLSLHQLSTTTPPKRESLTRRVESLAFSAVQRFGVRSAIERVLVKASSRCVTKVRASHSVDQVRREVSLLSRATPTSNSATWWPPLVLRNLSGVRNTNCLINDEVFQANRFSAPWPEDLPHPHVECG